MQRAKKYKKITLQLFFESFYIYIYIYPKLKKKKNFLLAHISDKVSDQKSLVYREAGFPGGDKPTNWVKHVQMEKYYQKNV